MTLSRAARSEWLAVVALAVLGGCESSSIGGASSGREHVIAGAVTYRERIALPPGATVEVRLEDVSRADAAAEVLAEETIATNGRQVPIPFELRYAADQIQEGRRYGLRASIRTANGQLMFTTTSDQRVLESGAASDGIEVVVQHVGGGAQGSPGAPGAGDGGGSASGAGELTGFAWRLVAIRKPGEDEQTVGSEARYTIEFGSDGRFFGLAHCNRYTGGYRVPGAGRLEFSAAAATMMACPEPSLAGDFLRAVGGEARYERSGQQLKLYYGTDAMLTLEPDTPAAAAASPEVGRTLVYDCDGDVSFTVRAGPGEVALWTPESLGGKYTVLSLSRSASGAHYEEGGTSYWSKGDLATFEVDGARFVDCRSNPRKVPWADAARRGVTFRGLGNEPAWSLEISADKLALITDLGESRTELEYAPPATTGKTSTYRASGEGVELVAVVDRTQCADSMSGEAFEATVTITFDGRTFYGCGRFL